MSMQQQKQQNAWPSSSNMQCKMIVNDCTSFHTKSHFLYCTPEYERGQCYKNRHNRQPSPGWYREFSNLGVHDGLLSSSGYEMTLLCVCVYKCFSKFHFFFFSDLIYGCGWAISVHFDKTIHQCSNHFACISFELCSRPRFS